MAIDEAQIGMVAARLMEEIASSYGDGATIETVAVIAAVDHGTMNTLHSCWTPNTPRYVSVGIVTAVLDQLRAD
jgi:hypothetical protein